MEKTTAGGIVIPGSPVEMQTRGLICRIGNDCQGPWSTGDLVAFETHAAREINDFETGETNGALIVLHEDDILCSTNAPLRKDA